jgi:hypothetical protein
MSEYPNNAKETRETEPVPASVAAGEGNSQHRIFHAGAPDDPKHGQGICTQCRLIVHYLGASGTTWIDDKGASHTTHEIELLPETNHNATSKTPELDARASTSVVQRITPAGSSYYRAGEVELGAFTFEDEQNLNFDLELAAKLSVDPKEVVLARMKETQRPTTFEEIADVLGSTVREDLPTKLILFSAGILTFTNEDQINALMSGESSGGKTHVTIEVTSYFPPDIVRIIGSASPKAFHHDMGEWDEEQQAERVNLRGLIIVFLDQPHYMLMERLRPLLSHDKREVLYKITDKLKGGKLRTKNVIIEGFSTFIFCAAKFRLDEQERTRVFMLSPETSPEKLEQSLRLIIAKVGDREGFKRWTETHLKRRWLKARISDIRSGNIKEIVIPDHEGVYERFLESHPRLAPRHQRDLPRVLALIKAHALLNWRFRESRGEQTIIANKEDVDAGFWLYDLVSKPNELGLAPQLYEIYESVIEPLINGHLDGVDRKEILAEYYAKYGRPLSHEKLRRDILPALESVGLILEQPDPWDKRKMRVCPPSFVIPSSTQKKGIGQGIQHDNEPTSIGSPDVSPISKLGSAEMTNE